ncbi:MAG: hypothetical protein LBT88_08015 [Oscillospiraceae bacterium]|jgi:hypothetical protein|nr:hypothetical protein [Oscillospiraceae bacterium]
MSAQFESFKYLQLPALRFIGIDAWRTQEGWGDHCRGSNFQTGKPFDT